MLVKGAPGINLGSCQAIPEWGLQQIPIVYQPGIFTATFIAWKLPNLHIFIKRKALEVITVVSSSSFFFLHSACLIIFFTRHIQSKARIQLPKPLQVDLWLAIFILSIKEVRRQCSAAGHFNSLWPYDTTMHHKLGQHWFRWWLDAQWHQATTWLIIGDVLRQFHRNCSRNRLRGPALFKEQGKSEGFDSCDRPSNLAQIWSKSSIFCPLWPWNLMDGLGKQ